LAKGVDITGQTVVGETALRIITENLYLKVLDLLLRKGAPTDVFNNNGFDTADFAKTQRKQLASLSEDIEDRAIKVCECLESPLAENSSGSQKKYYLENESDLTPPTLGNEACQSFGITIADFF
jgi:ankyrin repeat protein